MSYVKNGNGYAIHEAIRKYSLGNFKYEIIDGANSLSELAYREVHHIHAHNSLSPNGYNLKIKNEKLAISTLKHSTSLKKTITSERMKQTSELGRIKTSKKIVALDLHTGTKVIYSSISECSKVLDVCPSYLSRILRGKSAYKPIKNNLLEYMNEKTIKLPRRRAEVVVTSKGRKIKSLNEQTGEVTYYKNVTEASFTAKITAVSIGRMLRGKVKSSKSYIRWEYC